MSGDVVGCAVGDVVGRICVWRAVGRGFHHGSGLRGFGGANGGEACWWYEEAMSVRVINATTRKAVWWRKLESGAMVAGEIQYGCGGAAEVKEWIKCAIECAMGANEGYADAGRVRIVCWVGCERSGGRPASCGCCFPIFRFFLFFAISTH